MPAMGKYSLGASDGPVSLNATAQEVNIKGANYQYAKASVAITAGMACIVSNTDGTIQPVTTALAASVGPVADIVIPQFDMPAGDFGYVAAGPFNLAWDNATTFKVQALAGSTAFGKLYTTTTPGYLSTVATSSVLVAGVTLVSTVGGSNALTACVANNRMSVGIV